MRKEKILDYLFPPRCPACDGISAQGFCDECKKKLHYITESHCLKCGKPLEDEREEYCPDCRKRKHYYDQCRAVFSYRGEVRQSLYRFKYANKREYAATYAGEMERILGEWIRRRHITLIVPIPLHPSRKRKRGYNQAAILAKELSRRMGIPVDEYLLSRTKKTKVLKTLDRQERRDNLRGAFEVTGDFNSGENILLIDDIYTTGSTADQAALALKRHDFCRVFVVTVAIGG